MLGEDVKKRADADASVKEALIASLAAHMQAVNAELPHHEHMSFGVVVQDEWLINNGFLTPTMKIKRSSIEDCYGPKLDDWYADGGKLLWQ
jgi:long-subunit acyl-CoA synthetase (AMP-forming)